MQDSRTFVARAAGALFAVAVAALAAALAHLAIDIAGDYLLPHDAYDDVAHDSRTVVAAAAAALLLAGAARSLYASVRAALGRRNVAAAIRIESPIVFIGAVIGMSVPLLLAMETIDAIAARRDVDDLGDLFGGSIALGLGTTLAVAALVAVTAYVVLRFFLRTRAAVARAIGGLLQARERAPQRAFSTLARQRRLVVARATRVRHASKRGPP